MTPEQSTSQWYLTQIKANCASLAERNLARQGFVTFLPLECTTLRKGKRLVSGRRPYFPGYLFVGIDAASAPWRAIQSTQGVTRLVRFGSEPTLVPPALISALQHACDNEGCITAHLALAPGDDVRIAHGPFTNFIGEIERLAPDKRAWVLLEVMGKATRVSVRRSDVRLAT